MSLRIRRGIDSQRITKVLATGEIAWTTDTKKLYVGDDFTSGGINVLANSAGVGLEWNSTTQQLDYTGALGTALQNVIEDTSPQLGGNLDLNYRTIIGTGTIDFTGNISATALSLTTGLTSNLPLNTHNITGTGSVNITGNVSATGTLTAITGLGATLPLNGYDINGTGNISITGNVSASGTLTATTGLGANLPLNGYSISGLGNINIGGVFVATTYSNTPMQLGSPNIQPLLVRSITDGAANIPMIALSVSDGTLASPSNTNPGELLGGYKIQGWYNGSYKYAGSINAKWASSANLSTATPASQLIFSTGDNGSGSSVNTAIFDHLGTFTAPRFVAGDGTSSVPSIAFSTDGGVDTGLFHPADGVLCISTNAVERVRVDGGGMRVEGFIKVADVGGTLPSPAEAGMIVLDSGVFKGYNGTAWVDLS